MPLFEVGEYSELAECVPGYPQTSNQEVKT